jgi:hypothetical protein
MEKEDLTYLIGSLIKRGEGFSFEPSYDFGPMLRWMEVAFSVLAPLPEDQARFAKYSLRYKGHAQDRVLLGIDVLYNALINALLESENPVAPIINGGRSDAVEPQCWSVPAWVEQPTLH